MTDFDSTQIVCTIRLADHGTKPGTAIQCKTKDSNCHRQNSVRVLSGIRAAQSSVFCVVFIRSLFIIFFLFRLAIALPARLRFMTSDNSFGIYKQTCLICWPIHAPLYYPNYQIYFIVVYMPRYFLWVYSILMQVKTLFIT